MTVATDQRMTLQEFLTYGDGTDTRYELIKGKLIPMSPPTWLHLRIARYLEGAFNREIERQSFDWEAFQEPGQQTESSSARRPDVAIVPSDWVDAELDRSAVLGKAAFLVVEVVSESTATTDYREKVSEYQAIGIPEYWIVDPDPFGAAKYIGSPKCPTVSVYHLVDGIYQVRQYRDNETIVSPTFPDLKLTAAQVLAGKRLV